METINVPMNGGFDAKTIELADRFQSAVPGAQFKLCLFDSGNVSVDSVLAFHEIAQRRPKGIILHIHSHNCLVCAEVLVWLAGDTRTLRSDAWIHFLEYPRNRLARSDYQQFRDSLEGYEMPMGLTPFQENYLQIERLVKKHLPVHLLNRRVWSGELAEWSIIKPAVMVVKPESANTVNEKTEIQLGSIMPSEFAAEKPFDKK